MAPNRESNVFEPCRLCCVYNYYEIDILNEHSHIELIEKIFRCVAIHVTRNDKSTKICEICFNKINDFDSFRDLCAITNIQMAALLPDDYSEAIDDNAHELYAAQEIDTEAMNNYDSGEIVDTLDMLELKQAKTTTSAESHPCPESFLNRFGPEYIANKNNDYSAMGASSSNWLNSFIKTEESVNEELIDSEYDFNYYYPRQGCDVSEESPELATETIHTRSDTKYENAPSTSADVFVILSDDEADSDVQIVNAYMLGIDSTKTSNFNEKSRTTKMKKVKREAIEFQSKCKKCGATFECNGAVRCHAQWFHAKGVKRTWNCYLCKKTLSQRCTLKVHMNVKHTGQSLFKCPFPMCGKAYGTQHTLDTHENSEHTRKTVFECPKCHQQFYTSARLVYHRRTKHVQIQRRKFICSWCKKSYLTKVCFENHVLKHLGEPRD